MINWIIFEKGHPNQTVDKSATIAVGSVAGLPRYEVLAKTEQVAITRTDGRPAMRHELHYFTVRLETSGGSEMLASSQTADNGAALSLGAAMFTAGADVIANQSQTTH